MEDNVRGNVDIFGSSFGFRWREPVGIEATKAWRRSRTEGIEPGPLFSIEAALRFTEYGQRTQKYIGVGRAYA